MTHTYVYISFFPSDRQAPSRNSESRPLPLYVLNAAAAYKLVLTPLFLGDNSLLIYSGQFRTTPVLADFTKSGDRLSQRHMKPTF